MHGQWQPNKDMTPGTMKTLIVDDEPIARQVLREVLAGIDLQ